MSFGSPTMKPVLAALALAVLSVAGCTGLPEGSADFGDTVTVRFSATDDNGTVLRPERTSTFVLGSGASGMGLGFERALRGALQGENLTFAVTDDPSLGFRDVVEVDRALPPIQRHQDASRRDFEANVGPAFAGQQFPAFGVYTATVTGITTDRVNFTIDLRDADLDGFPDASQEDPVPSVGAILVSEASESQILRSLKPNVGATFTINPPSPANPSTPLGLAPGTYRTVGANDDSIEYSKSTSASADLIGKTVHFKATILRLVVGEHDAEPVDGNYAARDAPYVNGDPDSVLDAPAVGGDDDHGH